MNRPPEQFIEAAWASFLSWASGSADLRAEFTKATGLPYGADHMQRFVHWATIEVYGFNEAPRSYREAVAAGEVPW